MTKEEFIENNNLEHGTIIIEPFEYYKDAIIGISSNHNQICYSYDLLVLCLEKEMTNEQAIEYIEYNIIGTFECMNSSFTPIIINSIVY